jgi:P4 family phage/plasmid primase-like protien
MCGSDNTKKPLKAQEGNSVVTEIQVQNDHQMPLPRTFEGKLYYATAEVAKIIGVTKQAVIKWRNKGWLLADLKTHDGVYLYEVERGAQLKSVYHKNWTRGGYESMPTFQSQWLPYVTDSEIGAVKRLSHSASDDLKDKINSCDPHNIFEEAGDSRNPDKRKIICPICGNGKGDDATPVEADFKGDRWLYHCFRECGFQGDLLKIIADEERLNLHDFNDMCKALAIGAQLIGYPLDSDSYSSTKKKKATPKKKRETSVSELPLIQMDIADSQNHLDELPDFDRRSLAIETFRHFACGFLPKWTHPKIRLEKGKAFLTRRIIIPTSDKAHYLAALPLSDRDKTDKQYWKMHAGAKTELFNVSALSSDSELILVVEGEFDAMSIWQASEGNIAVVATLSVGGYKELLLSLLDEKKISDKKFLILFDGDEAGRTNAENLHGELIKRKVPAVAKFLFDFLTDDDKNIFEAKVDANELLISRGDRFLNDLISKIIADANTDFANVEKDIADTKLFDQLIAQWRDNHKNAPINPKILAELKDAKAYIENLTPENFNPDDAFNVSIRRKIALCKFYIPQFAATFFNILRDARDSAKKKIKDSENPSAELKNLANLAPSDLATIVNEVATSIKRDQKEYQKVVKKKEAEEKDFARWKEKQAKTKNPKLLLSPEQVSRLFDMQNTDLYNALRLDYLFHNEIKFLTDCDRWLTFDKDKGIWIKGNAGKNSAVLPFAGRLAMMLEENEPNPLDFPTAKKIIRNWQTNICVGAATNLLKGVNRIRITTDDLDNHPNLLNCKNGVIDLYDGKFYEIVDPALLLTQQVNAFYHAGYRNETVEKFLQDILPDEETRTALIRWLGYCITGDVSAEKALFIYGTGGNGKGTLTKLLIILLNNYAASVPVTAVIEAGRLKDAGAATTELNVLEKCRLAIVEELPQGGRLDVAKFKALTGGDKIPVRRLHEEFHNIDPTHKLMLSGNHMPILSDTRDPGLLRRLLNMLFGADFTKNPDTLLKKKLLSTDSLAAMLSLLVDAAQKFYRDGLIITNSMREQTRNYLAENDFIYDFISEYCQRGQNLSIPRQQFLGRLKDICSDECFQQFRNSDRALTDAIKRIDGISYRRDMSGYQFFGIGWNNGNNKQSDDLRGEPINPNDTPF